MVGKVRGGKSGGGRLGLGTDGGFGWTDDSPGRAGGQETVPETAPQRAVLVDHEHHDQRGAARLGLVRSYSTAKKKLPTPLRLPTTPKC